MVTSEMLLRKIKTSGKTTRYSIINEYGASELDIIFSKSDGAGQCRNFVC
jgi:hypothetical protein